MTSLFMPPTSRATDAHLGTNPASMPDGDTLIMAEGYSPQSRSLHAAPNAAPMLPAAPTVPAAPTAPTALNAGGETDSWAHLGWMAAGACGGLTRIFFAPHAERPQARVRREAMARSICHECPVLAPCRDYARMNGEYGFWGGESEEDRAGAGYAVPWPAGAGRRRNLAVAG